MHRVGGMMDACKAACRFRAAATGDDAALPSHPAQPSQCTTPTRLPHVVEVGLEHRKAVDLHQALGALALPAPPLRPERAPNFLRGVGRGGEEAWSGCGLEQPGRGRDTATQAAWALPCRAPIRLTAP